MDKQLYNQNIEELRDSIAWEEIKKYIDDQIEIINETILEQIDPEYNVPKYSEHDILRKQKIFYKWLKDLPDTLIK